MKQFQILVYIGNCFSYQEPRAISYCAIDKSKMYVPGAIGYEDTNIGALMIRIDNYYEFYLKYIDKKVCGAFTVKIMLNKKTLRKVFNYHDSISFLEKLKFVESIETIRSFDF